MPLEYSVSFHSYADERVLVSVVDGGGYFCEAVVLEDDSSIASADRGCLIGLENAEAIFLET